MYANGHTALVPSTSVQVFGCSETTVDVVASTPDWMRTSRSAWSVSAHKTAQCHDMFGDTQVHPTLAMPTGDENPQ